MENNSYGIFYYKNGTIYYLMSYDILTAGAMESSCTPAVVYMDGLIKILKVIT